MKRILITVGLLLTFGLLAEQIGLVQLIDSNNFDFTQQEDRDAVLAQEIVPNEFITARALNVKFEVMKEELTQAKNTCALGGVSCQDLTGDSPVCSSNELCAVVQTQLPSLTQLDFCENSCPENFVRTYESNSTNPSGDALSEFKFLDIGAPTGVILTSDYLENSADCVCYGDTEIFSTGDTGTDYKCVSQCSGLTTETACNDGRGQSQEYTSMGLMGDIMFRCQWTAGGACKRNDAILCVDWNIADCSGKAETVSQNNYNCASTGLTCERESTISCADLSQSVCQGTPPNGLTCEYTNGVCAPPSGQTASLSSFYFYDNYSATNDDFDQLSNITYRGVYTEFIDPEETQPVSSTEFYHISWNGSLCELNVRFEDFTGGMIMVNPDTIFLDNQGNAQLNDFAICKGLMAEWQPNMDAQECSNFGVDMVYDTVNKNCTCSSIWDSSGMCDGGIVE